MARFRTIWLCQYLISSPTLSALVFPGNPGSENKTLRYINPCCVHCLPQYLWSAMYILSCAPAVDKTLVCTAWLSAGPLVKVVILCAKSTCARLFSWQKRLPPTFSLFVAQRFNNLSPVAARCPVLSGSMTSSQPSVIQSILRTEMSNY